MENRTPINFQLEKVGVLFFSAFFLSLITFLALAGVGVISLGLVRQKHERVL